MNNKVAVKARMLEVSSTESSIGTSEENAQAVLWLCSGGAKLVTVQSAFDST